MSDHATTEHTNLESPSLTIDPLDSRDEITNTQLTRCLVRATAAALAPSTSRRLSTFNLKASRQLATVAIDDHNRAYPTDPIKPHFHNTEWLADAIANYALEFALGCETAELVEIDDETGQLLWRRTDSSGCLILDQICFERPTYIEHTLGADTSAIYRAFNVDCYLDSAWSSPLAEPDVPWFESMDAVETSRVAPHSGEVEVANHQ